MCTGNDAYCGDRTWADLEIKLDPTSTAQLAYRVGRDGTPKENRAAQLKAFAAGWQVSPIIILPDATEATSHRRCHAN